MKKPVNILLMCFLPFVDVAFVSAEHIAGVTVVEPGDVRSLHNEGYIIRYISKDIAIISCEENSIPKEALFVDEALEGEAYYLMDHVHEIPMASNTVFINQDGWGLFRMSKAQAASFRIHKGIFLWPLPVRYSITGWEQMAAQKQLNQPTSKFVKELIDSVDVSKLHAHVRSLSLIDTSRTSETSNLRSRFTLHPQMIESTEYIRAKLAASLPEVEVRPFPIESRVASSHVKREIDATDLIGNNVVGTLPGSDPEGGYYVICAHFDATAVRSNGWDWENDPAPGADDNASGVALVIESARILGGLQLPWTIRFIAFSGEELGLLGSRYYAENASLFGENILGVFNFDMIGFNDLHDRLELVSNPGSLWLVNQLKSVNQRYEIGLRIDVLADGGAGLSDHAPFWARGFDAIMGIENYLPTDPFSYGVNDGIYRINSQYHSVLDTPDSLNYNLVRKTTQMVVAALGQYANGDGIPNLAVFEGDLFGDDQDYLRARITNIGLGRFEGTYSIDVSHCLPDSTNCESVYKSEHQTPINQGSSVEFRFPWARYGEKVFRLDIETNDPNDIVKDNQIFQQLDLVPQSEIVVFPNPFIAKRDEVVQFGGVPLHAQVRVYSLDGELLWVAREDDIGQRRLGSSPNEVIWPVINGITSGAKLASGVYFYTVHDLDGKLLQRRKIAVIR